MATSCQLSNTCFQIFNPLLKSVTPSLLHVLVPNSCFLLSPLVNNGLGGRALVSVGSWHGGGRSDSGCRCRSSEIVVEACPCLISRYVCGHVQCSCSIQMFCVYHDFIWMQKMNTLDEQWTWSLNHCLVQCLTTQILTHCHCHHEHKHEHGNGGYGGYGHEHEERERERKWWHKFYSSSFGPQRETNLWFY